jgi:hypothetical protein
MQMLLTLLLSVMIHSHPLHVSFTSIAIDSAQHEATVTFKFYPDDFSLLFFHLYEKSVKPEKDKSFTPSEQALISKYMENAFVLVCGSDTVKLDFVRKDQDDEFVWLFYKGILPGSKLKNLVLTNKLLLDLYDDQTNLVIVTFGNVEQGFSFTYKNWQKELLTL